MSDNYALRRAENTDRVMLATERNVSDPAFGSALQSRRQVLAVEVVVLRWLGGNGRLQAIEVNHSVGLPFNLAEGDQTDTTF